MAYGIKLIVWGEYASFNRPEMKVERVSYDVITPSAARGILEAIYWKPEMSWVVDQLHVLAPINFVDIRRNEVSGKISAKNIGTAMSAGSGNLGIAVDDTKVRQQRAGHILRDVCYGIEAHIKVRVDNEHSQNPEVKHLDQFRRRAEKGAYFHHPYLGCREFPADFRAVKSFPPCPPELQGTRDLGFMLHDILFEPDPKGRIVESSRGRRVSASPRFFRAQMIDGVISVPELADTKG